MAILLFQLVPKSETTIFEQIGVQNQLIQYHRNIIPSTHATATQLYYLEFVTAFQSQVDGSIPQYALILDDVVIAHKLCEEISKSSSFI